MGVIVTPGEFQERLDQAFMHHGKPYGRLSAITDEEAKHAAESADKLRGHYALEKAFKCVFIESIELVNTYCRKHMKVQLSEHFQMFLPRLVHSFRVVCGASYAAAGGYPRMAFTTLRNAFDDCVMTSAALQNLTDFYSVEGLDPNKAFDPLTYRANRKTEERKVNKLMLGSNSGLEQATQDALKHLNDLYDMEVHGGRLSMTDAIAFMKMEGPLRVVPHFVPQTFALYMNRFVEVAWLVHRLLPAVQPPDAPMPDDWAHRWHVVDESFELGVRALYEDSGRKVGQEYPKFVAAKFPFNAKAVFPL